MEQLRAELGILPVRQGDDLRAIASRRQDALFDAVCERLAVPPARLTILPPQTVIDSLVLQGAERTTPAALAKLLKGYCLRKYAVTP